MHFGWIKLQYLLLYAVMGAYMPYMPVYLRELGLADWQIGWVLGAYGLAVLVMPAVMAHIADRHVRNRVLIGFSFGLSAVGLLAVAMVGGTRGARFEAVLITFSLFSLAITPLFSLIDGLTFSTMHHQTRNGGRTEAYHRIRIWGSIGFMLPALVVFIAMRYFGATALAAVLTGAAAAAVAATLSTTLPGVDVPVQQRRAALPSGQAWRTLLKPNVFNMVAPLVLGFIGISVFYAFYSLYLEELGVGKEWIGIISNIGVGAEVILMLFSAPILAKFGIRGVMIGGAACLAVRMALLTAIPTPTVAIVTQLLHAPIVLWLYLVPPMYLNLQAEHSYRNSMQSLFSVLCFGVARWAGSILGGHATQLGGDPMSGLRWAFLFALILGIISTLWLILGFRDDHACKAIRENAASPRTPSPAAATDRGRIV